MRARELSSFQSLQTSLGLTKDHSKEQSETFGNCGQILLEPWRCLGQGVRWSAAGPGEAAQGTGEGNARLKKLVAAAKRCRAAGCLRAHPSSRSNATLALARKRELDGRWFTVSHCGSCAVRNAHYPPGGGSSLSNETGDVIRPRLTGRVRPIRLQKLAVLENDLQTGHDSAILSSTCGGNATMRPQGH